MEAKYQILCCAMFVLVASSGIYGVKFLKKRNYLLGIEWLVVTFSGSNFLFFAFSGEQTAYSISVFCDAFSRGFGIPLVAVAGLMAVTHAFKPTALADTGFFAVSVVGTVVLVAGDFVAQAKPYFYVATWTAFSLYLAYFARRLQKAGEYRHAIGVIVALLASQIIAGIYDFYTIPGDQERMLFYTLAALTWSFLCIEMYYAYCALERAGQNSPRQSAGMNAVSYQS